MDQRETGFSYQIPILSGGLFGIDSHLASVAKTGEQIAKRLTNEKASQFSRSHSTRPRVLVYPIQTPKKKRCTKTVFDTLNTKTGLHQQLFHGRLGEVK